jgi:hypothetical protein
MQKQGCRLAAADNFNHMRTVELEHENCALSIIIHKHAAQLITCTSKHHYN